MNKFSFFLRYTAAQLTRNRRRTLFVLFCIAAGVAAVVSLRTLGLMIGDALTGNLQIANRGDIVLRVPTGNNETELADETLFQESNVLFPRTFSDQGIARVQSWAAQNGVEEISLALRANQRPITVSATDNTGEAALLFLVEPDKYPFYDQIDILQPSGARLTQRLADPDSVIISESLAEKLNLGVGDTLRFPGVSDRLRVTAIVNNDSESSLQDLNTLFFPFFYLPYAPGAAALGINANVIYMRTSPEADIDALQRSLRQAFPTLDIVSTADLEAQNSRVSEQINRLITTLGLVSLLIGGIGITNTMNVVVQRRAGELAVLKTLGVSGGQITLLFLIESLLLGVVGSLLGILSGLCLVFFLRGLGERVVAQTLTFAIYPQALLMGLALGVVVTLVFGFLPIISASRIRPNAVLSAHETIVPHVGRGLTLLVIAGMTFIIGLIIGVILDDPLQGVLIAYATMAVLGVLTWLLGGLLWLLGRLPAFGSIQLKLAQRFLSTQRGRMASTLLAMIVGVFSLSLILLMTQAVINAIEGIAEEQLGGNILALPNSLAVSEELAQTINTLPQIEAWQHETIYTAHLAAINDNQDVADLLATVADQAVAAEVGTGADEQARAETLSQLTQFAQGFSITLLTEDPQSLDLISGDVDVFAQPDSVLLYNSEAVQWLDLQPGDTLTLQFDAQHSQTVTVRGIVALPSNGGIIQIRIGGAQAALAPASAIPAAVQPAPSPFALTVAQPEIAPTVAQLGNIPGVFVLQTSQFNAFLSRLLEQLTALPLLIAVLALFSSSVIIANTVSLATQERRRQIGIMKALGLSTRQVLMLLLLENGLIGLLGGVLGTGAGVVLVLLTDLVADNAGILPLPTVLGLILLSLVLALTATLITAYGAARTSPLVVLRYE